MSDDKLPHILLDLDLSIISSLPLTENAYLANSGSTPKPSDDDLTLLRSTGLTSHTIMDDAYIVFERPFLQDFLDTIFSVYNVSVFTAASKPYASEIVRTCVLPVDKPDRKLYYLFWNFHGNMSATRYNGNHKNLNLLSRDFGLETFSNSILLDDTKQWSKDQEKSVIILPAFSVANAVASKSPDAILALKDNTVLLDLVAPTK